MHKRLMILEVSQKQAYIFSSKKLRDNAARSAEICYVTDSDFFRETAGGLYTEEENLVYAGGGHTVLQFENEAAATAFAKAVTEAALRQFPGLELFVKQTDYDAEKTPGENLKALSHALERKKALRRASFRQMSLGVERPNPESSPPNRKADILQVPKDWTFPTQIETLAGEDNFIAVVHIDGNGMGKRVERIYKKCSDWETCRRTLRRFSEGIQHDFEQAFRETVEAVIGQGFPKTQLPIRPVVLAGDDVCFVTAGSIGLECARVFLEKLSRMQNCEQPDQPYAACAGVALVHKKYPFHRAYDLAEELCSNAKRFGARLDPEGKVSAMDWHIEFGQLKDSLSDLREDYETEDGCRMELRPVTVVVPDDVCAEAVERETRGIRTYDFFQGMLKEMKGEQGKTARGKIKELRTAIKQGRTATAFFLRDQQISKLLYHGFSAKYQTAEQRKGQFQSMIDGKSTLERNAFTEINGVFRCLFFDAVEMLDHTVLFGEVDVCAEP